MKNRKLNFLKLGILIFGISVLLLNCIDENNIDLDQNDVLEQVMDFQSIETDEAKSLINTIITKNKKHSKKGGFSVTIDEKSLNFTEVKKTNLNIPTFSASIRSDIHSTVFMVKKHGVIYPCLYNYIPTKNNSSEGTIIVSTIDGEFINGYKVVDGVFVCQYKQKTNSETASKPASDANYIWDLGELYPIEIHRSLGAGGISFDNGYNPVTSQGWMSLNLAGGRSTKGGGSSNGKSGNTKNTKPPLFPCDRPTPRGCEEEKFLEQNVWDTQEPYDKWNKITECERDFFRSNPQHLYTARGNKAKAEKVAWERFGNCNTPNDRPMLNTIGDAYRHAYFAALNTHNMGYNSAKSLGDAHECDTPSNKLDQKQMDIHNNAWGYHYGSTISTITESQFYTTFMNAFNSGQIKILQECN